MASRQQIDLLIPPLPTTYANLIRSVQRNSTTIGFVTTDAEITASERIGLDLFSRWLLNESDIVPWAGPRSIYTPGLTAHLYECSDSMISELLANTSSLYDQGQTFPGHDMHFLRKDSSVVLGTISHEHDAWLFFSPSEFNDWKSQSPSDVIELLSTDWPLVGKVFALGVFMSRDMRRSPTEFKAALRPLIGGLDPSLRNHVANYLRAGHPILTDALVTRDVLGGLFRVAGGDTVLTDGVYCWWLDTAEYVSAYGIKMPYPVLEHMRTSMWSPPVLNASMVAQIEDFAFSRGPLREGADESGAMPPDGPLQ